MDNQSGAVLWLSLIVFLPALGALLLAFIPREKDDVLRYVTLAVTAAVLVVSVMVFLMPGTMGENLEFSLSTSYMQNVVNLKWIPSFDIYYYLGVDGISFPLVMLTGLISLLAAGASWSIKKNVKAYCVLFLLLETGMLGVFVSLDFFLFFIFWEVMLLPMYFLIGVWGGPRKEYAAIKFFIYTLLGGVMMLISILMLYFNSDVRALAEADMQWNKPYEPTPWSELHISPNTMAAAGRATVGEEEDAMIAVLRNDSEMTADKPLKLRFVRGGGDQSRTVYSAASHSLTIELIEGDNTANDAVRLINEDPLTNGLLMVAPERGSDGTGPMIGEFTVAPYRAYEVEVPGKDGEEPTVRRNQVHTFNMVALAAMGQRTDLFSATLLFGKSLQWWAFLLLFIGFIIKVPSVPFHTWLPDAHVEAPTPISMILAGVLLKMGGYGIIRICYPICPEGGFELRYLVCAVGVISMVYGAYAALAQKDFKRLVAYSSVSHMGYVVLGLGVWSATAGTMFNPYYWNMGVKGAMFQMIAHGISSAGMFFMVGVIYDRVHHRNLNEFGAIFGKMPVFTALSIGIFFAGLGLPGLCGFIGEVLVVLSVWSFSKTLAVISAFVVILTAGYILWALQRVFLGPEYKGPHEEALVPSTPRENAIAGVLFVLAIIFGVFPHQVCLKYMDATIDRQVQELADWTRFTQPLANQDEDEAEEPPQRQDPVAAVNQPAAPAAATSNETDATDQASTFFE